MLTKRHAGAAVSEVQEFNLKGATMCGILVIYRPNPLENL